MWINITTLCCFSKKSHVRLTASFLIFSWFYKNRCSFKCHLMLIIIFFASEQNISATTDLTYNPLCLFLLPRGSTPQVLMTSWPLLQLSGLQTPLLAWRCRPPAPGFSFQTNWLQTDRRQIHSNERRETDSPDATKHLWWVFTSGRNTWDALQILELWLDSHHLFTSDR